jgi:hypothetical protein
MLRKLRFRRIWRFALVYSIPVSILVSSVFFPLQPFVVQAMIGILLIWFNVSLMFGILPL